jgi:hypothetical protein
VAKSAHAITSESYFEELPYTGMVAGDVHLYLGAGAEYPGGVTLLSGGGFLRVDARVTLPANFETSGDSMHRGRDVLRRMSRPLDLVSR